MLISIEKYMRNQQEKSLWILAQILAGFLMRTIFSPTLLLLLSSSLQFLDERAFTLGSLASWLCYSTLWNAMLPSSTGTCCTTKVSHFSNALLDVPTSFRWNYFFKKNLHLEFGIFLSKNSLNKRRICNILLECKETFTNFSYFGTF